ncbi:mechanosensitive ion channel domain-containing protein [Planctomycetota bacterium]
MQRVLILVVVSAAFSFPFRLNADSTVGDVAAEGTEADSLALQPVEPDQDAERKTEPPVSLESIAAQILAIASNAALDEKAKADATTKLNEAKKSLSEAMEANDESVRSQFQITNADERKKELAGRLKNGEPRQFAREDRSKPLEELERIASSLKEELENAKDSHSKYLTELKEGSERKANASKREEDIAKRLETLRATLETMPRPSEDALASATRTELLAQILNLEAKANRDKVRMGHDSVLADHQTLRSDLHQRTVASLESQISQLNSIIAERRKEESRRQLELARKEARDANVALRTIAEENASLAEVRAEYTKLSGTRKTQLEKVKRDRTHQEDSFKKIVERINDFGMTQAIGGLLRSQRENLPSVGPLKERIATIDSELPNVRQKLVEYREQRERMFQIEDLVDALLPAEGSEILGKLGESEVRKLVRELLVSRKEILEHLNKDLGFYNDDLQELYFATKKFVDIVEEHAAYIDEHVLWIRSADAISHVDLKHTHNAFRAVARTDAWNQLLGGIGTIIRENRMQSGGVFLFLVLGVSFCDRMADRLGTIGKRQEVLRAYRFVPTVEAIVLTILLASFWPIVFAFLGWQLVNQVSATPLSLGIGHGLWWTAIAWWALNLLRQISRPDGLGEAHFAWHRQNLNVIRRNVRWLITFGLPFVFLVMGLRNYGLEQNGESTGRVAFIAGMVVMALFTHFMLNPYGRRQGIWAKQQIWIYKVRHIVHAIGVMIPISLALLCAVGYIYSAFQLTHRAHLTLWMVLFVVLTHALVTRYLLITRRRVAVKHMRQRQALAAETNGDQADGPRPEESLDFNIIGEQLQRLLRAIAAISLCIGITFVWADMVPALTAVNRVTFNGWEKEIVVEEFNASSNKMLRDTQTVPITLGDVIMSMLLIGGTLVATRNLPGLLNITIFERLPIDFGTRYALTTVVRYVTTMVGFVIAFRTIGFTWSSVQWLVAAMTVGLGFGLQEIFANFVSGLIILTERPIRVGDMVTVSGVMGKVTRMQIRATTITDFDRRELVVPNKKFITEDVINWTLSDSITRVVCPVGIAYRCDPALARSVLLDVARSHPEVLDDPEPSAVFQGFGDSTLNLELRVFIVGREQIAQIRDEINLAINASFRNANLEIAFPQRDLHIRSIDAVAEKILSSEKRAA